MRICSVTGKKKRLNIESLIDDFAVRSFRDSGDADYVMARAAFRCRLIPQALWASLQAVEKYLKCILLLQRIKGKNIRHSLRRAIDILYGSNKVSLRLTPASEEFIRHVDNYGRHRYFEISIFSFGGETVDLDRVVWELRRYCAIDGYGFIENKGKESGMHRVILEDIKLREGSIPQKYYLPNGLLEKVIDDEKHPAREILLWQNGFFGKKQRRKVRLRRRFYAANAPLFLHPELLDEVVKYVYLPKDVVGAYREMRTK